MLMHHYPVSGNELPPGWRIEQFGDLITDARSGYSSGVHNSDGIGVPHLRPMNIDRSGQLNLSQIKYVAPEASMLRLEPGDILFNNTNSREHVGKSAIFDLVDADWGFSNHITRVRLQDGILPKFVAYQLLYLWQIGYFRFHAKQHVNQASISTRTLTINVPILAAPLAEQQELIAQVERTWSILGSVEQVVTRANEQLTRYVDRTIIDAASGRLVPTEHEMATQNYRDYTPGMELLSEIKQRLADETGSLFAARPRRTYKRTSIDRDAQADVNLPPGWTRTRVDEAGHVTLGKKREPASHSGPYMRPYLRVANVHEDRIDVSDVLEMNFSPDEYEVYSLEYGDILLNEGQSPELVGRPAMYRGELPGGCFQMTLLRFRAHQGVSSTFALVVFRAYLRLGKFREAARWSTNIAHLSTRRFAALPFPLPPLEEQERIVEEVNRRLGTADSIASTFVGIGQRVSMAKNIALRRIFPGAALPSVPDAASNGDFIEDGSQSLAARPTKRTITAAGRSSVRTPLMRILLDANGPLKPDELFVASGYPEELVDDFYTELRRHVMAGEIKETRDTDGEPVLAVGKVTDEA